MTSVAATALEHVGLDPRTYGLDGVPVTTDVLAPLRVEQLVNGDAEWSSGNFGHAPDRSCPGWRDVSALTVARYSAPSVPSATDPGPPSRGSNLFVGGALPTTTEVRFDLDLGPMATLIDAGALAYDLTGWLGGVGSENDRCVVELSLRDGQGTLLRLDAIGPVTLAERVNAFGAPRSGLLRRATTGPVSPGSRHATVRLRALYAEGPTNDGCADELSLTFRFAAADCNGNGIEDALDVLFGGSSDANANLVPDECECDVRSECSTSVNSVGAGARLEAAGSTSLGSSPLTLEATGLPPAAPALVLAGRQPARSPLADGWLCIAPPVVRLDVTFADAAGAASWTAPSATHLGAGATLAAGESFARRLDVAHRGEGQRQRVQVLLAPEAVDRLHAHDGGLGEVLPRIVAVDPERLVELLAGQAAGRPVLLLVPVVEVLEHPSLPGPGSRTPS